MSCLAYGAHRFYAVLVLMCVFCACSDNDAKPASQMDTGDVSNALPDTGVVADTSADPDTPPMVNVDVTLEGQATAMPCETVVLTGGVEGDAAATRWDVEGIPLLYLERGSENQAIFRAPVVNMATDVTVTLRATDDQGLEASAQVTVQIQPAPVGAGLADGMALGCGPFALGVASGDPYPDSVLLWTRVTPPLAGEPTTIRWRVALDPFFDDLVEEGDVQAFPEQDYGVTVEVDELAPGTHYYYQFETLDGDRSVLGRTKTAAGDDAERIRLAVGSCSSVWSGFFNPYARIAERADLDLVVHLGDLVYDFVDGEEQLRLPEGDMPADPKDPGAWRERFVYYLSDPDQRRARQVHPWAVIWDNHDSDTTASEAGEGTIDLYRDYVPMRRPDPDNPRIAYRTLRYGALMDLFMVDALTHKVESELPEERDILGGTQWTWLEEAFGASNAAWKVIGSQKLISSLVVPPIGLGEPSPWDEFPESRARLYDLLGTHSDNLLLSGDLHFSISADFTLDPTNPDAPYDPATGEGARGVEVLATSITRGNFDETLCGGLCGDSSIRLIADVIAQLQVENPHIGYMEGIEHGYGVLDISAERTSIAYWYSPIRSLTRDETLAITLTAERGANRLSR